MKIEIFTIPDRDRRYPTVGDWQIEGNNVQIFVSQMGDWRHEALVAVHELIEALLCKHRGISQAAVDKFDLQFEAERQEGVRGPDDEPGDDPGAPYGPEHRFATAVEMLLANELDVRWSEYEKAVSNVGR